MRHAISRDRFPDPNVLSGEMPDPLLCNPPRGWAGIQLRVYPGWHGEVVTQHPYHMVSLQLAGTQFLRQRRDGRSMEGTFQTGDIIVTPMGTPKEWCNEPGEHCEVLVLNLLPSLFDEVLDASDESGRPESELVDNFGTRDPQIEYVAKKLLAESQIMDVGSGMYVEALARELTVHLLRHHSMVTPPAGRSQRKLSQREIQRITEYVSEHLQDDLTVRDLAATLFMSPSHFAHVFKRSTNIAPHRFVIECRIERAKEMLRESRLPVAEVAQSVGFTTHANFSVAFRRVTCRTPLQFRSGR